MRVLSYAVLACSLLLVSGCATSNRGQYYWGSYQELVYKQFQNSDKANPSAQIAVLERDIQIASSRNQALPPGFYAHLAYQHLLIGQKDKAVEYLALEKDHYPESSTYMDFMLKNTR
jgi:hypothetical protein